MTRLSFCALQFAALCVALPLLLLGSACAPKELVRQPELEPYAGPVTVEVLKSSVGFRDTKTIKALTEVSLFRNGRPEGSFSGVFGYQAPDSLKTSLFGPFGITVMDFLITGDLIQVYLPTREILYEMRAPEISLSSLTEGASQYSMQEQDEFYLLYAYASERDSSPAAAYYFDKRYLLNRRIILYNDGGQAIMIDFDDFNGRSPEKTELSFGSGTRLTIALKEPEYDSDIPPAYFQEIERKDKNLLPLQNLLKRFEPIQ